VARESTVVFKGLKPLSERHPEIVEEGVSELRELVSAVEPRLRNIFQQHQGIRLKLREQAKAQMPGDAVDAFYIDGDSANENCHFSMSMVHNVLELGLVVPNHAKSRQWERFNSLARDKIKFLELLKQVRAELPELWIRLWHRHDMGAQKLVHDGEARFKVDTIYGFDAEQTENRYFKPASSWYVLMKELVSERMNHRFNLEIQFYVPFFLEPDDPRGAYREKISPYLATPDQPEFVEESVRIFQTYAPLFSYMMG
jgi:hypothetical protein